MRKRMENLKKVINPTIVDGYIAVKKEEADNELDALYLAFYAMKAFFLKYNRRNYGELNNVQYTKKFDWNSFMNEYVSQTNVVTATQPNTSYSGCYGYYPNDYSSSFVFVDYDSYFR